MGKVASFFKGLASLAAVVVGYVDNTYSPLAWVLFALIAFDLIANAHDEMEHLKKLGSAALSIGLPGYISGHYGLPDFQKYVVILLTVVYVQIVFPQLFRMLGKIRFSSNPKVQQADVQDVTALLQSMENRIEALAQKVDAQAVKDAHPFVEQMNQQK